MSIEEDSKQVVVAPQNAGLDTLRPKKEVPTTFPGMLNAYKDEIARALPKQLNAERLTRIALTEFRKNPALGRCNPTSVFASVIVAAQMGLEPGVLGQGFMVPYKNECQFIPGWQGLVDLVNRTGRATVWTEAVFEGDEFSWGKGDRPFIQHKPCGENDPKLMTHAYAVGRVNGSEWPIIECWTADRITKHRNRYNKQGDRHYSYRNFEMYARKIVLLQVIKYMPKTPELSMAVSLEHASYQGQNLEAKAVIEGSWAAPPYDENTGEIFVTEQE